MLCSSHHIVDREGPQCSVGLFGEFKCACAACKIKIYLVLFVSLTAFCQFLFNFRAAILYYLYRVFLGCEIL